MALDKNKAGIMAAIQAATEGKTPDRALRKPAPKPPEDSRAHRALPKGTVGSVRAGLGGIQDIDTALIVGWGPEDRLELTAVNSTGADDDVQDLVTSIREAGQQVPVLLRPAAQRDGHFEVVYGRRRIVACKALGQPVKALIRTLDDGAALMAKGLENAARQDLSYYERARFAAGIL
ncbi:MAG: ParB/RepB/Spo0J family partition protein, partial [Pseudomonadota bacterium]